MGKYYENSSSFAYSWEQLVTAFWRRYPNPYSTHVLSEDTLCREFRGDCLYTRRILTKTNRVPKWGERFVKNTIVAILEESYVDRSGKVLTTYTRNIGYNRIMSVTEKVIYTPDPENPSQTIANREAWVDSQMYGFRRAIEAFGLDRFRNNCSKAVSGFNYILQILYPQQLSQQLSNNSPTSQLQVTNIPSSCLDDTKEKIKEKAKKAGELARKSAGQFTLAAASNEDS